MITLEIVLLILYGAVGFSMIFMYESDVSFIFKFCIAISYFIIGMVILRDLLRRLEK